MLCQDPDDGRIRLAVDGRLTHVDRQLSVGIRLHQRPFTAARLDLDDDGFTHFDSMLSILVMLCCHMRTTVTLDADVEQLIRRRMAERQVSFKQALNEAIRDGAVGRAAAQFSTRTADLGVPSVNLDRALQIAADLEDDELIRRQRRGA